MIGAIFINNEAFYPDYRSKKVKIPQSVEVTFYDVNKGVPKGKANINSGTYSITNYQKTNGKMYLYTDGFWLLATDLTQYLVSGGQLKPSVPLFIKHYATFKVWRWLFDYK